MEIKNFTQSGWIRQFFPSKYLVKFSRLDSLFKSICPLNRYIPYESGSTMAKLNGVLSTLP